MKKLVNSALAVTLVLAAGSVSAQEPGDVGVFADAAGTQSQLVVAPFTSFNIYINAFDLDQARDGGSGGVSAFEFFLSGFEGLTLLNTLPGGYINLGTPALGEFIVATGECLADQGVFNLQTLTLGSFSGADVTDRAITIGPSVPSSFGGLAPGYAMCDLLLRPFGVAQNGGGVYPDGGLILNPTQGPEFPVSNEDTSFGEIKARF